LFLGRSGRDDVIVEVGVVLGKVVVGELLLHVRVQVDVYTVRHCGGILSENKNVE
jgi:hypothetical protein